MKKGLMVALCAMVAPLLGGCLAFYNNSESDVPEKPLAKEHIVLKTTSPPGQEFSGTLKVDGEPREIHATSPWELQLDCAKLKGQFRKLKGDGDLSFEISREEGTCSFSASPGCKFDYSAGGVVVTGWP